jgi:hypothetical protein
VGHGDQATQGRAGDRARHRQLLKDRPEGRGVFIAREPEIRPSRTTKGRGESTDIWIEALIGRKTTDAERATIVIELKGSSNKDLMTALRGQLVDRYLDPPSHRDGIYLVARFSRDHWTRKGDITRYAAAGRHQLNTLRDTLTEQAIEACIERHIAVDAVVLDGSLPPLKGPAGAS